MRRRFEEILRLAETASQWDLDSEEGYAAFRKFARQAGIKEKQLAYYLNAYEAAGESGLRALTYKYAMPENIRVEATRKINGFLAARLPKNQRGIHKVRFQVMAEDNRITGAEKRPLFADPTQTSCVDCFQVRYTDFDRRWHLYWKRASGKWWPYVPDGEVRTIEDCLRELKQDASGCFWG